MCSQAHQKQNVTGEYEGNPKLCDTGSWHWEFKEGKGQSSRGKVSLGGALKKVDLSEYAQLGVRGGKEGKFPNQLRPSPQTSLPRDWPGPG